MTSLSTYPVYHSVPDIFTWETQFNVRYAMSLPQTGGHCMHAMSTLLPPIVIASKLNNLGKLALS